MRIDVSDPSIRREINARLQRERELLDSAAADSPGFRPPGWIWSLIAHVAHLFLLLGQYST